MKVVSIGKATDLVKEIPKAPTYLDSKAKSHFKKLARVLIEAQTLKKVHLPSLEIMAENFSQWEWAVREIRRKNKNKTGSGYKQKFNSGAENISVELSIKRDAEKAIMQCFKQFGLDPKSEKELKRDFTDPNQGDLFKQFANLKKQN